MEWYNYEEEERIKQFYTKYTLEDFWNYWSDKEEKYMEVRIKNFELIKNIHNNTGLPYSPSGIYVKNYMELKTVWAKIRDITTCWFGIQGRKKNWNIWGKKGFGGKDVNVTAIEFLFIDIDRILKIKPATKEELEKCDILAEKIIERMATQGWNKDYIKICSGNGVQLVIRLDVPIKIPNIIFDNKLKIFIMDEEFEQIRQLIPKGIGKDIITFSNKFKNELNVEVDKSCFKLSQVGSLPFSKNFKYDGFRWRAILEIKQEGKNEGLSDYILSKLENIKIYNQKNVFVNRKASDKDIIKPGHLKEHILVKFMLENELPVGQRNNYIWCQIKCLLRDSSFDFNSEEFKQVKALMEKKQKMELNSNVPEKNIVFSKDTVNRYCINNCIPPIYTLWSNRTNKQDMKLEGLTWEEHILTDEKIELNESDDIIEDMEKCKKLLVEGDFNNKIIIRKFTNGCIEKYGEEKAKYYFDKLFYRYFSFR